MSFGIPELLIYVVPILAGVLGSRHFSRLANFCLIMIAIFQFDVAILPMLAFGGEFCPRPLLPYTVVAILPRILGNSCREIEVSGSWAR